MNLLREVRNKHPLCYLDLMLKIILFFLLSISVEAGSIRTLLIGQYPGDPSAKDSVWSAMDKINRNFSDIQPSLNPTNLFYTIINSTNLVYTNYYITTNVYATNIYGTNLYGTNIYSTNIINSFVYSGSNYISGSNMFGVANSFFSPLYFSPTNQVYFTGTNNFEAPVNYINNITNYDTYYTYTTNFTYTTNLYQTNYFTTNAYTSFNITTNNTFNTNLFTTNVFTTNTYSYTTNIVTTNNFTTNYNYSLTTNVMGLYADNITVTNYSAYFLSTNNTGPFIVVDISKPYQLVNVSANCSITQTTNRPIIYTIENSVVRFKNTSGSTYYITNNTSLGWKYGGGFQSFSTPYPLASGDIYEYTFTATGGQESDMEVWFKWYH